MIIAELCTRDVVIADRDASITDAAKLMRAYHVGDLIIVEERKQGRFPIGIITDRDLVIGVLAEHADRLHELRLEDVMSRDVITVRDNADVFEVLKTMRTHGIRRVPVVGREGQLIGVVSFGDLIELIAEQMADLSLLLEREHRHEKEVRDVGLEGTNDTRH